MIDQEIRTGSKTWLYVLISIVAVIVLGGAGYLIYNKYFHKEEAPKEEKPAATESGPCSNISTSDWKTLKKTAYTIKYPADWTTKDIPDKAGVIKWSVSFLDKNKTAMVWIGETAANYPEFEQALGSTEPGFDVLGEEIVTVAGQSGKKVSVAGHAASYNSYIYYLPYHNLTYLFEGPQKDEELFTECEPEKFLKMLDTLTFGSSPAASESPSTQTFNGDSGAFSFDYPSGWEIRENYYYETPAGEKASVPTIVLAKTSQPKSDKSNLISINMRQATCQGESATKSEVPAGDKTVTIYTLSDDSFCAESEATGRDINGKSTTYSFITLYTLPEVKDVFIALVESFK